MLTISIYVIYITPSSINRPWLTSNVFEQLESVECNMFAHLRRSVYLCQVIPYNCFGEDNSGNQNSPNVGLRL